MSYGKNEGSNGHTRLEQLEAAAEARKCNIVLPKPYELQIDIDSEEQLQRFMQLRDNTKISKILGIKSVRKWPSPSSAPGRYHVLVQLESIVDGDRHRVFLQAVLGSDPVRELLAWERISKGIAPVSCFFEKRTEGEEAL